MGTTKISNSRPVAELTGYVLTGGMSRRMGRPKHLIELNGRSLEGRACEILEGICNETVFVSGTTERAANAHRSIADLHIKGAGGPLIALLTAAEDCRTELFAVVPCDMPFVTKELYQKMLAAFDEATEAVVTEQPDGFVQPLVAVYKADSVRRTAPPLISAGRTSPAALLENISTKLLAWQEIKMVPNAHRIFTNLNTPEDVADTEAALACEVAPK